MLKVILTEVPTGTERKRYNVGVSGTAPSGLHVHRPAFLHHGPWCKSTAKDKAKRLQDDLDNRRVGHLLGWYN